MNLSTDEALKLAWLLFWGALLLCLFAGGIIYAFFPDPECDGERTDQYTDHADGTPIAEQRQATAKEHLCPTATDMDPYTPEETALLQELRTTENTEGTR